MEAGPENEGPEPAGDAWHVARTMRALEMLALSPLSAPQLAATIETHPRTMRRVLERLVAEGYVQRSGDTRRIYSPTMRLVALAAQVLEHSPVARRGRPYVELLHERTGVAAHLMAPSYGSVVCLSHAALGSQDEHPHLRELVPAHATAAGKALLAHRERWRRSLLAAGLAPHTDRTLTDPVKLEAELGQIRADGHAIEDGEYQHNVRAVAAPVHFGGEVVAAVSASGRRLDIDAVLPHVLRAARDLSQDLADGERR
jgi:IclR family KDG regulon transcriptional repressor